MGRGTWPGTIKGPGLFSTFQATNVAMRKSNPIWLWTGKFSDDCSPLAAWSDYKNGLVQDSVDEIWDWKERASIAFHLSGKKRPFYYIFRKEGIDPGQNWDADVKLGECIFDRKFDKRQLGIHISCFADDKPANKYGYTLEWDFKAPLANLAYRLQDMKYLWPTEFLRTCVQAYVVGKLQFASALYWLRASQACIRRARFDYCMALAAVTGCNVAEIVGLFNCKSRRVSENCKNYQSLCKYLDLPTMKTMAVKDAKSLIKQWFIYDKSLFSFEQSDGPCPPDSQVIYYNKERFIISGIKDPKRSLIHDIFDLSREKIEPNYPQYDILKRERKLDTLDKEALRFIQPEWITDLELARENTISLREDLSLGKPAETDVSNTFWLMCRDRFKVLERYHRVVKHLDITPVPVSRQQKRPPDTQAGSISASPRAKRRRIHGIFTCDSKTPYRRLKNRDSKIVCWICGYHITQKKSIEFKCCDRGKYAHTLCWRKQSDKSTEVICTNVKHYFKRAARGVDTTVIFEPPVGSKRTKRSSDEIIGEKLQESCLKLYCSSCDDMIDPSSNMARDHLKYQCRAIPSTPLKPGFSKANLARRMAALGLKKKLHKHNFTPHPTPTTEPGRDAASAVGSSLQ